MKQSLKHKERKRRVPPKIRVLTLSKLKQRLLLAPRKKAVFQS